MKNWKTNITAVLGIAIIVVRHIFPEYVDMSNEIFMALCAAGFLAAKDYNVTGGTKEQ